jgi:hypothetical protein
MAKSKKQETPGFWKAYKEGETGINAEVDNPFFRKGDGDLSRDLASNVKLCQLFDVGGDTSELSGFYVKRFQEVAAGYDVWRYLSFADIPREAKLALYAKLLKDYLEKQGKKLPNDWQGWVNYYEAFFTSKWLAKSVKQAPYRVRVAFKNASGCAENELLFGLNLWYDSTDHGENQQQLLARIVAQPVAGITLSAADDDGILNLGLLDLVDLLYFPEAAKKGLRLQTWGLWRLMTGRGPGGGVPCVGLGDDRVFGLSGRGAVDWAGEGFGVVGEVQA